MLCVSFAVVLWDGGDYCTRTCTCTCTRRLMWVDSHSGRLSVRLSSPTARQDRLIFCKTALLFPFLLVSEDSIWQVLHTTVTPTTKVLQEPVVDNLCTECGSVPFEWLPHRAYLLWVAPAIQYVHADDAWACTDTLTCTKPPANAKCNGASASATAAPARLQLHLQAPGKTCLSPSEASSAGQTDPIQSNPIDSTRLDST